MTQKTIRAIVIDDESLAREYLRTLLSTQPDFELVGEAPDGRAGLALLEAVAADVVFLDVHMPGLSGLEIVETLGESQLPLIVFVTAFDEYAIKAFDIHAVDYLLKPFDDARFENTLARIRERLLSRPGTAEQKELLRSLGERLAGDPTPRITRIPVRQSDRVVIVSVEQIDWIEAADYCVTIHTSGKSYLLRESLTALEQQLDPAQFVRSHRSALVNIERVLEARKTGSGDYQLLLSDGAVVPLSRRRRIDIERAIGRSL